MSELSDRELREFTTRELNDLALRARSRAGGYWWLAGQGSARRTLTQEECILWAREADEFGHAFEQLARAALQGGSAE